MAAKRSQTDRAKRRRRPADAPPLTSEAILRAAAAIAQERGIDAVTMRAIAAELDCEAMSLYNHVPNKAAILDGVAEVVLADLELPDLDGLDWDEQLRRLMWAIRSLALEHPQVFPIIATRHIASPVGVRPVEAALRALERAGFEGELAVRAFWALMNFASGAIRSEILSRGPVAGEPVEHVASGLRELDPGEFPHAMDIAHALERGRHADEFEFGLELLLRGLRETAETRAERPAASWLRSWSRRAPGRETER